MWSHRPVCPSRRSLSFPWIGTLRSRWQPPQLASLGDLVQHVFVFICKWIGIVVFFETSWVYVPSGAEETSGAMVAATG